MAWTTPKTNWATGELVTAEDMNAIGENLALMWQRANNVAVYTTTENIVIPNPSGVFVDVDAVNLNLTLVTSGGDVLISFHGTLTHAIFSAIDVEMDGNRLGSDSYGILGPKADGYGHPAVSFTRIVQNVSAGSHVFKLQTKRSGTLQAGAQFWVREI